MRVKIILLSFLISLCYSQKYEPTWESLDSRPLPTWYDEAKFGIFIHWGVFSVPSFGSEWFWERWQGSKDENYIKFMEKNYPSGFTYQDFAPQFTAEFYDPDVWADLFNASRAKYIVLTSKHHEGYTLWPSKYSFSWNAMDVGPKRDLLGDLANSIRNRTSIKFGLYHSLYEWFNPLWLNDKNNNFSTSDFVTYKTMPELKELVETYQPEVIWSDGEWEASDDYWTSKEFIADLYNNSPMKDTVVVNDRWGHDLLCKHGDFYTCADRYNPGVLQKHKWENCMTIDKKSWGYRRNTNYEDFMTTQELIKELVITVSCGGNLLMNVGPTKEGTIIPIFQERLIQMGQWLDVNGEAIFKTKPYDTCQNDTLTSYVWYTEGQDQSIYAILLEWNEFVTLNCIKTNTPLSIYLLGHGEVQYTLGDHDVVVHLPPKESSWAWVLKINEENSIKIN